MPSFPNTDYRFINLAFSLYLLINLKINFEAYLDKMLYFDRELFLRIHPNFVTVSSLINAQIPFNSNDKLSKRFTIPEQQFQIIRTTFYQQVT